MFLKAPFSFLIHILNWKDCQVDPIGFAPLFPSGDKTFSRFKNVKKPYRFLKVQYTFTKTTINGKSLNWTPTGYTTYLPSGDKTFSRFKNLKKRNSFFESAIYVH